MFQGLFRGHGDRRPARASNLEDPVQEKKSTKFWFSVPSLKADGQRFRLDTLKLALRSYDGLEKYVSVQPYERGRKFFISFELTKDSILQSDLTESPNGTVLSLIIDPELTELTAPKGLDKESHVVKILYALNKATILDLCFGEVLSKGINRIREYFKGKAWVRLLDDDREIEIHMKWTGDPKEKMRLRDEQEFDLSSPDTPIEHGLRVIALPQHVEDFNFRNNLVVQSVEEMGEDVKQFLRSISDPDLPCELKEVMWVEPVENTRSRDLILKNLQKTIEAAKDRQSRVDLCGIILGFNPPANTKPCSREVIEQLEKIPLEDEQRTAIVAKTKLAKQREAWIEDHIDDRLALRYAECTNKRLEGPLREVEELIEKKIWNNTLLAFTTLESALKVPLSFGATMLVIEEAGRATEPQALIPITRFSRTLERIMLVGDTRHLLPFSLTDYSVTQLRFLQRLMRLEWNQFASLRQQREIHPVISEAIRKIWYRDNSRDSELLFLDGIAFNAQGKPEENSYIICDHPRVHSLPKDGFYRQIVKRLFDINDLGFWIDIKGKDNDAESILTPYASQRELLTDDLQDQIENGLSVSSFEEYQLHRDVVLISLVRANEGDNVGFLNNRNRLCAGFIHARYIQIIFGNHDFMTSAVTGFIRGNNERAMKDLVRGPYRWKVLRDPSKRLYERYIKMADF
ncbi:hypothetical protein TWF788_006895 [Orbilia oligospora]|uniref:DNA2/NAM7 helicase-like C-terminal domain-containing protein n=1 Tax=Orbilia oligospora TaxID=2813651 RepID=A0A7C8PUB2_ORBOL|nr:hypothetical protein TWF788_006895 [Orbilia oligospora]